MRSIQLIILVFLSALALAVSADEREMSTGDGRIFDQEFYKEMPTRQENGSMLWSVSSFDTNIDFNPITITDHFSIIIKGRKMPNRIIIEDLTGPAPVVLVDDQYPASSFSDGGFRRTQWNFNTEPCPILRDRPCSAWMFLGQPYRIYHAVLIYADGSSEELFQAEPYNMSSFIERLADRIPAIIEPEVTEPEEPLETLEE